MSEPVKGGVIRIVMYGLPLKKGREKVVESIMEFSQIVEGFLGGAKVLATKAWVVAEADMSITMIRLDRAVNSIIALLVEEQLVGLAKGVGFEIKVTIGPESKIFPGPEKDQVIVLGSEEFLDRYEKEACKLGDGR